MKIDLYAQTGEKKGQIDLNKKIFEVEINEGLIHEALIRQMGNKRTPIAHTKIRSEVRGGGRKPYAQKHTGQSRQGTIRAPQWVGGGVVFGPRNNRNYKRDMPKKQRRLALFSALSAKAQDNQIFALDNFTEEKPKTKTFAQMLKKLPITRKALFVLPEKNELIAKSSRNIPNIKTLLVNYLNINDLLKYDTVVFLEQSLPKMEQLFLSMK